MKHASVHIVGSGVGNGCRSTPRLVAGHVEVAHAHAKVHNNLPTHSVDNVFGQARLENSSIGLELLEQ